MSDTYRRYRAIKDGIMQFYHPRPHCHREKHLNTLAALICGLVGGGLAQTAASTIVALRSRPCLRCWLPLLANICSTWAAGQAYSCRPSRVPGRTIQGSI